MPPADAGDKYGQSQALTGPARPPATSRERETRPILDKSWLPAGNRCLVGRVSGLGGEVVTQKPEGVVALVGAGRVVATFIDEQGASPGVAAPGCNGPRDQTRLRGLADVAAARAVRGSAELRGPDLLVAVTMGDHQAPKAG